MATDKQKLARARNWFKFTLIGCTVFNIRYNCEFAYSEREKNYYGGDRTFKVFTIKGIR